MAEVLGVVSAAAQLATLCCSLLRVMNKIKGAGLTLQNYQLQLQDLSLLSSSISRNPLLQTSEIEALTQSLLSLISQANLTFVLKKHRIIRTLYVLCRERDLIETLTAVERQKLSLCLSIEQVQSDALYEIRANIQDMSHEKPNVGKKRICTAVQTRETLTSRSNGNKLTMKPAPVESTTTSGEPAHNSSPAEPVNSSDEESCAGNSSGESVADGSISDKSCPGSICNEALFGCVSNESCPGRVEPASTRQPEGADAKNNPAPGRGTTAARETGRKSCAAERSQTANEAHDGTAPLVCDDDVPEINGVYCNGPVNQIVGNAAHLRGSEMPFVEDVSVIRNVYREGTGNQEVGSHITYEGQIRGKVKCAALFGSIRHVVYNRAQSDGGAPADQRVGGEVKFRQRGEKKSRQVNEEAEETESDDETSQ